jgi:hypothetical protein
LEIGDPNVQIEVPAPRCGIDSSHQIK